MAEKLDLYSRDREPINKSITRGDKINFDEYFIVVLAIIINRKNEILLTKRSMNKKIAPGLWECSAGSVISGETSKEAILREVKEEVGLDLNNSNFEFIDSFYEEGNAIFDIWFFMKDFIIEDIVLDNNEVDKAILLKLKDLESFINNNEITNSLIEVLNICKTKKMIGNDTVNLHSIEID